MGLQAVACDPCSQQQDEKKIMGLTPNLSIYLIHKLAVLRHPWPPSSMTDATPRAVD